MLFITEKIAKAKWWRWFWDELWQSLHSSTRSLSIHSRPQPDWELWRCHSQFQQTAKVQRLLRWAVQKRQCGPQGSELYSPWLGNELWNKEKPTKWEETNVLCDHSVSNVSIHSTTVLTQNNLHQLTELQG